MDQVDVLVIGAGFAGLSTAYHLGCSGGVSVALVERDKKAGAHASGNNAGMIRQAIADPAIAVLAREGRNSLAKASHQGWRGLAFEQNGSLLTAKEGPGLVELTSIARALRKNRLPHRYLSRKAAVNRVSALKTADFSKALFCPSDSFLSIQALMDGFVVRLGKMKVPIHYGHPIRRVTVVSGGFIVRAGSSAGAGQVKTFFARKIVNAAGAWAGEVGRSAHAFSIPFKAYRRHLFIDRGFKPFSRSWPFVWDLSHEVYFRPYGGDLMLSPCDKELFTLEKKGVAEIQKEKTEPKMRTLLDKKLKAFLGFSPKLKIRECRAGLRTMSPDGRFVIGEDPKLKNFFWVAGLGGHGVTTSFSVGRLASDIILKRKTDKRLTAAFSPRRFTGPRP